jgi:tripartite-type tricarboxylate transporter receptor subunit TctC
MVPQIQSGHIRGLMVSARRARRCFLTSRRWPSAQRRYPSTWFGLFAPARTPKPIVAKIAGEVTRIVNERDFRQRMFIDRAVEPSAIRLETARFVKDERKVAERIVKEAGLQPE